MPKDRNLKEPAPQLSLEELMAEAAAKAKAQVGAITSAATIAEALALVGPMLPNATHDPEAIARSPIIAALAAHPDPKATSHMLQALREIVGGPLADHVTWTTDLSYEKRALASALLHALHRRGGSDDAVFSVWNAHPDELLRKREVTELAKTPEPPPPPPAKAAPKENGIDVAPTGRAACRGCREKIAKGELRFGMAVTNMFSESGDLSMRWYHLRCAAQKVSAVFGPVLDAYKGEVPDREMLKRQSDEGIAKKKGSRR